MIKFISLLTITLTAYSPEVSQCDLTPYITAFNTPVQECTIAVSRDLEDLGLRKNCYIHIPKLSICSGFFRINDRMHWRKLNQGDVFFFLKSQAVEFGIHREVTINPLWCEN